MRVEWLDIGNESFLSLEERHTIIQGSRRDCKSGPCGASGGGLQTDQADQEQGGEEEPLGGGRLSEPEDADDEGAEGADAGPNGVGGADGQDPDRAGEEHEAGDHRDDHDGGGDEPREAVRELEGGGPDDFEQTGEEQTEPGHGEDLLYADQKKRVPRASSMA